jgi:hypothetical protein
MPWKRIQTAKLFTFRCVESYLLRGGCNNFVFETY